MLFAFLRTKIFSAGFCLTMFPAGADERFQTPAVSHAQPVRLDPAPWAAALPGPQNPSNVCSPLSPAWDSSRGWGSKFNPKWCFFFSFFPPLSTCSEAAGRQTAATAQQRPWGISGASSGPSTGVTGITLQ